MLDEDTAASDLRRLRIQFVVGAALSVGIPGQGLMKPEQQEIERLRREVVRLKAERDILKKATAFFAKELT